MRTPPFVITLWDIDTAGSRGRNQIKAVITDARDVGVSSYANEGGEAFFTLTWNHPQISQIVPWQRHYEVKRYNSLTGDYDVVGVGLLNDFEATEDEVIAYGQDYLSLLDLSISSANTSYASTAIGTIIQTEVSAAISTVLSSTKPVSNFLAIGTIDTTSTTVTVLTSYQPRLQFIQQLCDLQRSDGPTRPIVSVTRSAPFTVSFNQNQGSDKNDNQLKWGSVVGGFRYQGGWNTLGTWGYAIGQKREGASVLTANVAYGNTSNYGRIERATVFLDIVDTAALTLKTRRFARNNSTPDRRVALVLRNGSFAPWGWGELGDSLPVVISRGLVSLNGLYTVWGQEWIGKSDGSEDLFLSIVAKET